jgi:trans-aconitate 2-methyltransferase
MAMSWDSERYNAQHHYVTDYGMELLQLLQPKPGELILDLGCGTGKLSHEIAQYGVQVVGIDSSPQMIQKAKASYSNISFEVANGRDFNLEKPFNAVFSNAALHWMEPPEKPIACVWKSLTKGGRFVFEMGGKNNIKRVLKVINQALVAFGYTLPLSNYFPTLGEYSSLLEAQGFRVTYMQSIDRPTCLMEKEQGLRNWIQMFRPLVLKTIPAEQHKVFFEMVEQIARPSLYHEDSWWVDYVRLRGIAVKETY